VRVGPQAVLDLSAAIPIRSFHQKRLLPAVKVAGSDDAKRWRDLADRVRRGDSSAEEELSEHFHPRIVAMAVVRLRDPEAARDIAQEVLLAVLVALREGKLREPEKLPGFVSGTARNLVNNHFRSLREQPNLVTLDPETPSAVNPGTEAELAEQRRTVRGALERIDPRDRLILLLTLVEGMNPREIAPRVGLSAENVRTRKMRTIRQVTEELQKLSRKKGQTPLSTETVR
jgi:RNA polymerase sigma factor (sigma-70 family)